MKKLAAGSFMCTSKDTQCHSFVLSGKCQRTKFFCLHWHVLFCAGVCRETLETVHDTRSPVEQPRPSTDSTANNPVTVAESNGNIQRRSIVLLQAGKRIPYKIPTNVVKATDKRKDK